MAILDFSVMEKSPFGEGKDVTGTEEEEEILLAKAPRIKKRRRQHRPFQQGCQIYNKAKKIAQNS